MFDQSYSGWQEPNLHFLVTPSDDGVFTLGFIVLLVSTWSIMTLFVYKFGLVFDPYLIDQIIILLAMIWVGGKWNTLMHRMQMETVS